jgi:geranylgeranyl diphosphate synthase type II
MAFEVLATHYSGELLSNLVLLLSKTAGASGMIGGQVLDCMTNKRSKEIFEKIHVLKTGMLFSFSTAAPAIVGRQQAVHVFENLGKEIGVLFQLQDDLFDEAKKDERIEENILSIVSRDELITLIEERKKRVLKLMEDQGLDGKSEFFKLIKFLFDREY